MTNEKLRIGLVGPGEVADNWLAPAINAVEGTQLWSVMSRDEAKARAFAAKHGAAAPVSAFASLDAMLADPQLDAVLIATPDGLHAQQTIAAAEAGKHVLVEKPMATSVDDAARMISACAQNGVTLGVAYQNRWHAGHRAVAQAIHAGAIGVIRHMRIEWANSARDAGNWRAHSDVGRWWAMAALGPHCLDIVRWMMTPSCGEVVDVRAITSDAAFRSGRDETANIALRFKSGATADLFVSVCTPKRKRVEIYGSTGEALLNDTLGARGAGAITVNGENVSFDVRNPYEGEIADFAVAVRGKREPEVGGVEAMRQVALLCLAQDDARRK